MRQSHSIFLSAGFLWVVFVWMGPTAAAEPQNAWKGDIAFGYNQSSGNTEKSSFNISGNLSRMFGRLQGLLKGDVYTSSTNNKLDDQKWFGLIKTSLGLDEKKKWFFSFQLLLDHDRFADIDVRITPSTGFGYWISQKEEWQWNIEAQLGYETTKYRSAVPDDNSAIAVLKTHLGIKVFDHGKLAEILTYTPSFEGEGNRLTSETTFSNPLSESLDLNVKFLVDNNSQPAEGKEKTDTRLTTGIKYSF